MSSAKGGIVMIDEMASPVELSGDAPTELDALRAEIVEVRSELDSARAELDGARAELVIARSELVEACVGESRARSELNHMHVYIQGLHDKWAENSDHRSLEEVVDRSMAKAQSATEFALAVAERAEQAEGLRRQLDEILSSRTYQLFDRFRRRTHRMLPVGSRRRAIYLKFVRS